MVLLVLMNHRGTDLLASLPAAARRSISHVQKYTKTVNVSRLQKGVEAVKGEAVTVENQRSPQQKNS